jgi:predicted RNA-binding protein YlxR (DUF448 family)
MVPIEEEAGADGGTAVEPRDPLRRCILTGTVQPKDTMIRFVVAPDGGVVPDLEGSLPGRGLWLTAERAVVEKAMARKAFARAARRPVQVDADLADRLATLLARRCLNLIGLARRAGQAVAGFEKVREALRAGRVGRSGSPALLLAAGDGAADGRSKLRALAGGLPVLEDFDAAALGAALGRDLVVHAVLARGSLADHLRVDAGRYARLKIMSVGRSPVGQTGLTTDQSDTND